MPLYFSGFVVYYTLEQTIERSLAVFPDALMHSLKNCSCGRAHATRLRAAIIEEHCLQDAAQILFDAGFPKQILVVAE